MHDALCAPALASRTEAIEVSAWSDLFDAAPATLQRALGLDKQPVAGGLALRCAAADHPLLNRVLGLGHHRTWQLAELRPVIHRYADAGITRYLVHADCTLSGQEMTRRMAALGLGRYPRAWVKLARPAGHVRSALASIEVRPTPRELAQTSAEILCLGFGLPLTAAALFAQLVGRPRWHLFTAFDGRRPIACAGLFVDGQVASLTFSATAPDQRQRGAQRALIERRLRVAFALGVHFVCSETGEAVEGDPQHSYRNMAAQGFAPLYLRDNFAAAPLCEPRTLWTPAVD